jgi:hypothetical protein
MMRRMLGRTLWCSLGCIAVIACGRAEEGTRTADSNASATPVISGSDTASCNASGLLDIEYTKPVPILGTPAGNALYQIRNDSAEQDYYMFDIRGYADGFFLVDPSNISTTSKSGWIAQRFVFVYGRNYSRPLTLHAEPRENSAPKSVIREWWNGLYSVERCKGDWLYVRATIAGKPHEGWMPKDMQCNNPYTTCS